MGYRSTRGVHRRQLSASGARGVGDWGGWLVGGGPSITVLATPLMFGARGGSNAAKPGAIYITNRLTACGRPMVARRRDPAGSHTGHRM